MTMDLTTEAEMLRKVPMFSKLELSKLKLLAFTSELCTFDPSEVLFEAGDAPDSAYVIMEGAVEIVAETETGSVVEGVLGTNELFGELGVLTNSPRSATIRAQDRLVALRITDEMFLKLLAENPAVALDVMRQLSEKLVRSHEQFVALQKRLPPSGAGGPGVG
ncbi:MAG: Crp/Fnr family transcriptional regulator [Thiotrichales bacterium]|nr:Crp/Fnr family transcriptional regulator [Thiotrichales bacterium]